MPIHPRALHHHPSCSHRGEPSSCPPTDRPLRSAPRRLDRLILVLARREHSLRLLHRRRRLRLRHLAAPIAPRARRPREIACTRVAARACSSSSRSVSEGSGGVPPPRDARARPRTRLHASPQTPHRRHRRAAAAAARARCARRARVAPTDARLHARRRRALLEIVIRRGGGRQRLVGRGADVLPRMARRCWRPRWRACRRMAAPSRSSPYSPASSSRTTSAAAASSSSTASCAAASASA